MYYIYRKQGQEKAPPVIASSLKNTLTCYRAEPSKKNGDVKKVKNRASTYANSQKQHQAETTKIHGDSKESEAR